MFRVLRERFRATGLIIHPSSSFRVHSRALEFKIIPVTASEVGNHAFPKIQDRIPEMNRFFLKFPFFVVAMVPAHQGWDPKSQIAPKQPYPRDSSRNAIKFDVSCSTL